MKEITLKLYVEHWTVIDDLYQEQYATSDNLGLSIRQRGKAVIVCTHNDPSGVDTYWRLDAKERAEADKDKNRI